MPKRLKAVQEQGALVHILETVHQEIGLLREEMETWADNLDAGGLGHTLKAEEVREVAEALTQAEDEVSEVLGLIQDEAPETVYTVVVSFTWYRPYGYLSRPYRAGYCAQGLRAVAQALADGAVEWEEADELSDRLSSVADDLEALDFPRAYG